MSAKIFTTRFDNAISELTLIKSDLKQEMSIITDNGITSVDSLIHDVLDILYLLKITITENEL